MLWKDLSLLDKNKIFKEAVKLKIYNLNDIRNIYNSSNNFSEGGFKYTVKKGDSLYKISKNLGVNFSLILKANSQLKDPNKIFIGDTINIPRNVNIPSINNEEKPIIGNNNYIHPNNTYYSDKAYIMDRSTYNKKYGTNYQKMNEDDTLYIGKDSYNNKIVVGPSFALPQANVSIMSPKSLRNLAIQSLNNEEAKTNLNRYIAELYHNIPEAIKKEFNITPQRALYLKEYYNNPNLKHSESGLILFNPEANVLRDIVKKDKEALKASLVGLRTGAAALSSGTSELLFGLAPSALNVTGNKDVAKALADTYQHTSFGSYVDNPYAANLLNTALQFIGNPFAKAATIPLVAAEIGATYNDLNDNLSLARLLRATEGMVTLRGYNPKNAVNYLKSNYSPSNITNFANNRVLSDVRRGANIGVNYGLSEGLAQLNNSGFLDEDQLNLINAAAGRQINKSRVFDRIYSGLAKSLGGRSEVSLNYLAKDAKNSAKEYLLDALDNFKTGLGNIESMVRFGEYTPFKHNYFGYNLVLNPNNLRYQDPTTNNFSSSHVLRGTQADYSIVNGVEVPVNNKYKYDYTLIITGAANHMNVGDRAPYSTYLGKKDGNHIFEFDSTTTVGNTNIPFDIDLPKGTKKVETVSMSKIDNLLNLGQNDNGKVLYNAGGGFIEVYEHLGKLYAKIVDNTRFHTRLEKYLKEDSSERNKALSKKGHNSSLKEEINSIESKINESFKDLNEKPENGIFEYNGTKYQYRKNKNGKLVLTEDQVNTIRSDRESLSEEVLNKRNKLKDILSGISESAEENIRVQTKAMELEKLLKTKSSFSADNSAYDKLKEILENYQNK